MTAPTYTRSTFGLLCCLSVQISLSCLSILEIRSQSRLRVFIHQMPHINVFTIPGSDLVHSKYIPTHSFLAACFILYPSVVQFPNENNRSSHCQVNYIRESCQYTRNDNSHQGFCCNTPHIASHPDYYSTLNKRPPQVVIE